MDQSRDSSDSNIAELVAVTHRFGKQVALKKITSRFKAGKTSAIIGRSGSGKSTVIQCINGLIRPTEGFVNVFGQSLNYESLPSLRLKIGYMVQGTGLFPHFNVEQNISISRKIIDSTIEDHRVDELMDLVGLPKRNGLKYPHELSGGEQQRVGICRALFLNPPLLLMDEPFGALDPIIRKELQDQIIKLQRLEARSILMVTHDIREAMKLADYTLVLDEGEFQQFDTTENVIANPANDTVKRLIDASVR